MKPPKPIFITERLASVYPDELRLAPEQAFQAFGIEFKPEYTNVRLEFDVEEDRYGNSYRLELFGSRPETSQETEKRELEAAKIIASQNRDKQKKEEREKKELARLKKKYEK
jgi:hypothetical protein